MQQENSRYRVEGGYVGTLFIRHRQVATVCVVVFCVGLNLWREINKSYLFRNTRSSAVILCAMEAVLTARERLGWSSGCAENSRHVVYTNFKK